MFYSKSDLTQITEFYNPVFVDIENAYINGYLCGKKYYDNYYEILNNDNIIFMHFPYRTKVKIQKEISILLKYDGIFRDGKTIRAYEKHLKKIYKITKKAFDKVVD